MSPLAGLLGPWHVARRIADRRAGQGGRFTGQARFEAAADGLEQTEEGWLTLGPAGPFRAARTTLWRYEAGRILLAFADGRPFHALDPAQPRQEVTHLCGADRYEGRYDFRAWPLWSVAWRVTGPAKDYLSVTRLRPQGALAAPPPLGDTSPREA